MEVRLKMKNELPVILLLELAILGVDPDREGVV
jgi:hypothetical protein